MTADKPPMLSVYIEKACWEQIVSDIENMCGLPASEIEILKDVVVFPLPAGRGKRRTAD